MLIKDTSPQRSLFLKYLPIRAMGGGAVGAMDALHLLKSGCGCRHPLKFTILPKKTVKILPDWSYSDLL